MQISVNITILGKTITLDVAPTESIESTKFMIQEQESILPDCQRLVFKSKQLDDNLTLEDYNIQDNDTLDLFIKKRGN